MDNKGKQQFLVAKIERRTKKRTEKRAVTGEEVIFYFWEGLGKVGDYQNIQHNYSNQSVVGRNQEEGRSYCDR